MVLYYLLMSLVTRAIYGSMNTLLKHRVLGFSGNPYHVDFTPVTSGTGTTEGLTYQQQLTIGIENRIHEMEALNDCEKQRLQLFLARSQFPRWLASFRRIQPIMSMAVMTLGGIICVAFSGLLTTILYNGRVSECWKKAVVSSKPESKKKPNQEPPEGPPERESSRGPLGMGGSIAASLPNAERPKASKVNKRLHAGAQKAAKAYEGAEESDGGSAPVFAGDKKGPSRVVNMPSATNSGQFIEAGEEKVVGSFSKSPVSFLDIFSRNAPANQTITESLLPKKR